METNTHENKSLLEQEIFESPEAQFPAKTNLLDMNREELAQASRNLLLIWKEIDDRNSNESN